MSYEEDKHIQDKHKIFVFIPCPSVLYQSQQCCSLLLIHLCSDTALLPSQTWKAELEEHFLMPISDRRRHT